MNERKMLNSLKKVCFIRKKMNTLYGNAGKVFWQKSVVMMKLERSSKPIQMFLF